MPTNYQLFRNLQFNIMFQGKKIGLALSGGGARGVAHIGVLRALAENGIEPDVLSGTSAGAIVATWHAAGLSIDEMVGIVAESSLFKAFKLVIPSTGLTSLSYLRDKLVQMIPEDNFSVLKKPTFIAISNLNKGELEIRSEGSLFDVVLASSSIPLIFKPVEMDGQVYVDGGLFCNLPVEPLQTEVDYIIGVDVMPAVERESKSFSGWYGIGIRCFELSVHANSLIQKHLCDHLIEVKKVVAYHTFQFNKYKEIEQLGYEAALQAIDQIVDDIEVLP